MYADFSSHVDDDSFCYCDSVVESALHCIWVSDCGGKMKRDSDTPSSVVYLSNHTRDQKCKMYKLIKSLFISLSYNIFYHSLTSHIKSCQYLCSKRFQPKTASKSITKNMKLCSGVHLKIFRQMRNNLRSLEKLFMCLMWASIVDTKSILSEMVCWLPHSITKSEIEQKHSTEWKLYDEIS